MQISLFFSMYLSDLFGRAHQPISRLFFFFSLFSYFTFSITMGNCCKKLEDPVPTANTQQPASNQATTVSVSVMHTPPSSPANARQPTPTPAAQEGPHSLGQLVKFTLESRHITDLVKPTSVTLPPHRVPEISTTPIVPSDQPELVEARNNFVVPDALRAPLLPKVSPTYGDMLSGEHAHDAPEAHGEHSTGGRKAEQATMGELVVATLQGEHLEADKSTVPAWVVPVTPNSVDLSIKEAPKAPWIVPERAPIELKPEGPAQAESMGELVLKALKGA
eukprot:gnl/Trimastix_PCT/2314.p2 GENE.gnl/Trimastix_PCT/2314~~gnl/Trimastix_PCT/2314.p2  ORF type:complete len:277 (-),score=80.31 gnl/Trimastix_PCT/2314:92-922(-)